MAIAQFSGLASGIDSASLIDALVKAKQSTNEIRQKDIDFLNSENDALDELDAKFRALSDLIEQFRLVNGGGVNKKTSSFDPTVATATASAAAVNATYRLNVTSIANTATGSFNNSYSSSTSYVSTSGSGDVSITFGTGADQKVITAAVTANSTTLQQLADSINSDSNASSRLVASVVNIGSSTPDYRLVFTTLESGTAKGTLALAADGAITELTGAANNTINQATNAVFSINGIAGSITRAGNTIEDVISGLTLQLYDDGETTITVSNDSDRTYSAMEELIAAYNDIVEYINTNDKVDRVENGDRVANVYGTLAKTRLDEDFLYEFRTALSTAGSAKGTAVTSMAELGLKTNRDGTITIVEKTFKEAIANDALGAGELLNNWSESLGGTDGFIYKYTKLNGQIDIAQMANQDEIKNLQATMGQLDRQIDKMKTSLERQFSNLEKVVGKLQSDGSALSGILAGLSK